MVKLEETLRKDRLRKVFQSPFSAVRTKTNLSPNSDSTPLRLDGKASYKTHLTLDSKLVLRYT